MEVIIMYGPVYDIDRDKIIICTGTIEKLIKCGVKEDDIVDTSKKAIISGLNLRYKTLRKIAKEKGGYKAIEELNNRIRLEALSKSPLAKMGRIIN